MPRAVWSPLESILVLLLAIAGTTLFVLPVPARFQVLVSAVVFGLMLGAATVLWVTLRHPGSLPALRLAGRRPWRDVVLGVWAGPVLFVAATILAVVVVTVVALIAGHPIEVPPQVPVTAGSSPIDLVLVGLAAIVTAPVGEELFFRALLFGGLRRRFGFWVSAIVSSAVFSATHLDLLRALPLFLVGMGLAWVYERRSLLASMTTHAMFNVFGFALLLLAPSIT